jgi:hypothetical protein
MAWWKTAKPGDPVVCVDDIWEDGLSPLRMGRIYIVQDVLFIEGCLIYHGVGWNGPEVLISGVRNPYDDNAGFAPPRFRPAKTKDLPESIKNSLKVPTRIQERIKCSTDQ